MTTPTQQHAHSHHEHTKTGVDPVCGMSTDEKNTFIAHEHEGQTYYFCSEDCLTAFTKDPAQYTAAASPSANSSNLHQPAGDTLHTCPMHPEIVRDKPGSCPKCGMALEPRTVAAGKEEKTRNIRVHA